MKKYRRPTVKHTVVSNPHYKIITVEDPLSIAAESYRRVKIALEFANVDTHPQVIQICSSVQGEGKSIAALNLAATYAEDGKKVIVVDLDFRRPKLHRSFKEENKNGIIDVLVGNIKLKEAIIRGENGIDCLNRGSKAAYPTVILNSKSIKEVFAELRKEYEFVIVDCPPILAVGDAVIISKLCDGCVFIISQTKTEKNAAKEAIKQLRENQVNIYGCVITGIVATSRNNYFTKYRYYYQNYYGRDVNPGINSKNEVMEDER